MFFLKKAENNEKVSSHDSVPFFFERKKKRECIVNAFTCACVVGTVPLDCVRSRVLQCVAVCCSGLQCVAVCCSVLQCVAVCCSALCPLTAFARLV